MHVLNINGIFSTTYYTYDRCLEVGGKCGSDAWTLYTFYCKQSHIQNNKQSFTLNKFVREGLGWSDKRVKNAKKILRDLGLIDDVIIRDEKGLIVGRYVRVNYSIDENDVRTAGSTYNLSISPIFHPMDTTTDGGIDTNTLNITNKYPEQNLNTCVDSEQETTDNIKERKEKVAPKEKKERKTIDYPNEFEKLRGMYPHYEHRSIKEKTYDRWILLSDIEKERLYGAACELNILVEGGIEDNKYVAGLQVYINRNRNDEKDVDLVNLISIIRKQSDETKRIAGLNRARDIFGKNVINPIIINSSKSESGIKLNLY